MMEDAPPNKRIDKTALRARGRLKNARRWFAHRGWDVLPQGIRGQRILRWCADQIYLANPTNPKLSVRNQCRKLAPWLTTAEMDGLLAYVATSNKRWSDDQCATVLEITVRDRQTLGVWFVGADDDPNYEQRRDINKRP
jgi:hypothetical protein